MQRTPWRAWAAAWTGAAVLGVANGIARQELYADRMDEQRAHQLSTATLGAATTAYIAAVDRRWPIRSTADAVGIGVMWAGMTVTFEFGFGRLVAHESWEELTADYDLRRGRLWPLFLGWMVVAPAVVRRRRARRSS